MISEEERGGAHPGLLSGISDLDAVSFLGFVHLATIRIWIRFIHIA